MCHFFHFFIVCPRIFTPYTSTDSIPTGTGFSRQCKLFCKNCIDIAAQGNACAINGVLYAPWQAFSDIPKEKRWENSAQVLREAAEYGAEKGIDLHVEVINRFESDFMNTLEEGAAFLEKVNHAHVKLLVDTFHMNIEEDNMFFIVRS